MKQRSYNLRIHPVACILHTLLPTSIMILDDRWCLQAKVLLIVSVHKEEFPWFGLVWFKEHCIGHGQWLGEWPFIKCPTKTGIAIRAKSQYYTFKIEQVIYLPFSSAPMKLWKIYSELSRNLNHLPFLCSPFVSFFSQMTQSSSLSCPGTRKSGVDRAMLRENFPLSLSLVLYLRHIPFS